MKLTPAVSAMEGCKGILMVHDEDYQDRGEGKVAATLFFYPHVGMALAYVHRRAYLDKVSDIINASEFGDIIHHVKVYYARPTDKGEIVYENDGP